MQWRVQLSFILDLCFRWKLHGSAPGKYHPVSIEQVAGRDKQLVWTLGRTSNYDSPVVDWSLHPPGSVDKLLHAVVSPQERKLIISFVCYTRSITI